MVDGELNKKLSASVEFATLGTVLLAAIALRSYKLGSWPLEGDELNTLRDSLTTSLLTGPKPLLFFLNYSYLKTKM